MKSAFDVRQRCDFEKFETNVIVKNVDEIKGFKDVRT